MANEKAHVELYVKDLPPSVMADLHRMLHDEYQDEKDLMSQTYTRLTGKVITEHYDEKRPDQRRALEELQVAIEQVNDNHVRRSKTVDEELQGTDWVAPYVTEGISDPAVLARVLQNSLYATDEFTIDERNFWMQVAVYLGPENAERLKRVAAWVKLAHFFR